MTGATFAAADVDVAAAVPGFRYSREAAAVFFTKKAVDNKGVVVFPGPPTLTLPAMPKTCSEPAPPYYSSTRYYTGSHTASTTPAGAQALTTTAPSGGAGTSPLPNNNVQLIQIVENYLNSQTREATIELYGTIDNWDVSNVQDFSGLFCGSEKKYCCCGATNEDCSTRLSWGHATTGLCGSDSPTPADRTGSCCGTRLPCPTCCDASDRLYCPGNNP